MNKFIRYLDNKLDFNFQSGFYAILGTHVSTTARSPRVWNEQLETLGKKERMFPLDVSPANFPFFFESLIECEFFLGGAVAVPYKGVVATFLAEVCDPVSKIADASNCIYRSVDSRLRCTNTDGLAAVTCLKEELNITNDSKILILGFGGVGRAITAALEVSGFSPVISSRQIPEERLKRRYPRSRFISWGEKREFLAKFDVVINCTTLGSAPEFASTTPLSDVEMSYLRSTTKIYDVIYNPAVTLLGKQADSSGIFYRNGLRMNQIQAEIAMKLAICAP